MINCSFHSGKPPGIFKREKNRRGKDVKMKMMDATAIFPQRIE
jgi:hypothetical protein